MGATSLSLGVEGDTDAATSVLLLLASVRKSLGKGRALAHRRALPVNDVDGDDKDERDAEENRTGILEVSAARSANIREEKERREWSRHQQESHATKVVSITFIIVLVL